MKVIFYAQIRPGVLRHKREVGRDDSTEVIQSLS